MRSLGVYCGDTLLNETDENGPSTRNKIMLEYYRVEKNQTHTVDKETSYGITIIKKEFEQDEVKFERNCIEEITTNENIIDKIIEVLKKYKVTPIGFNDVLTDLLKLPQFQECND